jgi:endonuclease/exonuclease/phosphatase family metal-dependent hydrolase
MKLFIIICIIFALIIICGCKQTSEPDYYIRTSYYKNINKIDYNDSLITCVTFNIQLGFRADSDPWTKEDIGCSQEYINELANHLQKVNPDIICLQEVPRNRYNAVVKNFIENLASKLNMNYAFGAHGFNDPSGITPVNGEWGNAILTKYPILNITNYENEYLDIWQKRSILTAELKNGNNTLLVSSLHFITSDFSVPNSIKYFSSFTNPNSIILGDFNLVELPEFEEIGYYDVFKSENFLWGIDKILIHPQKFSIHTIGIIPGNQDISDHLANYCTIKYK